MDQGKELVLITNDLIERAKTPAGSWTRAQLAIIGVAWPPEKGWRKRISQCGFSISKSDAQKFIDLGKGSNSSGYAPKRKTC